MVEMIYEAGAMRYFDMDLFVACLSDESHASHVLVAGSHCSSSTKCSRTPSRDAPPDLIATKRFWEATTIDFSPTKLAIGTDCQLEKQKVVYERPVASFDSSVWVCREFRVMSGRNSNSDGWMVTPVTNIGLGVLKSGAEALTSTDVALPQREYNVDWLSDVYGD
jgi:hypothetical protein